ncbi:hypothetical protein HPP92_010759 [Vanilla planifolia]|uniref:Transmembrane protein n=1 Tax=Vanilla planifolia TaxID=51239 RepID=A0A835QUH9_VANPL|nr:hypothetical protein HPP92_010759 [Vanilla planifolia]
MDQSKHLGSMAIIREAIYLPTKNKKLMLSAFLLCFVPSSLLLTGNSISIYPLLLNLLTKLYLISRETPNTPQFFNAIIGLRDDADAFVRVYMILVVASYVVSTTSTIVMVHSSLLVYSGKHAGLSDVFSKVKSTWLRVFTTCIYSSMLYMGYTALSVGMIAVPLLRASGAIESIVLGGLLALLARLLLVYLTMEWMVGVVVSVAEENCYGLEALRRGGETVKGKRLQGFIIALVMFFAEGILSGGYGVLRAKNAMSFIVMGFLIVLMKLFSHLVYSLFYCECRKEAAYTRVLSTPAEMLP